MNKYKQNEKPIMDILLGILFVFALVVIPTIVKLEVIPVSDFEFGVIRNAQLINDVFSYYKGVALITVTAFMIGILLLDMVTSEEIVLFDYKNKVFILASAYALLALISSIFSKYNTIAFKGISERYEGFFVLLCYMILMVIAMFYTKNKFNLKFILFGLLGCIFVVGIIGLFQYLGMDIFKTDFGAKMVFGKYYSVGKSLNVKFDTIYSTLYNPNCVGLFVSMMLPFSTILAVFLPIKSWIKYVSIALTVIMIFNFIGCGSVGAVLGAGSSFAFMCIVGFVYFIAKKKYKSLLIFCTIAIAMIVGVSYFLFKSDIGIAQKFRYVVDTVTSKEAMVSPYPIKDMKIEDKKAIIYTVNGDFSLSVDNDNISLFYNDDLLQFESISPIDEGKIGQNEIGKIFKYNLEGFEELLVQIDSNKIITFVPKFYGYSTTFLFKQTEDGGITALKKDATPVDISEEIPSIGFEGVEFLGSSRGYIWSRSIPLIKSNIIIGKGPDSFTLEYPQHDIVGKLKFLGNPYVIVDKPHNIYLQMIVNTGCLSLFVCLGIFILYIIQTIRVIIKNDNNKFIFAVRLALLAAIVGYLFGGLTTDSVVSVAPIFWIMLGTGFAVNKL